MSYRVLIRAFTLRRDVSTSYLVKGYLETKNCEVRISSVREFNFFKELATTLSYNQHCGRY